MIVIVLDDWFWGLFGIANCYLVLMLISFLFFYFCGKKQNTSELIRLAYMEVVETHHIWFIFMLLYAAFDLCIFHKIRNNSFQNDLAIIMIM